MATLPTGPVDTGNAEVTYADLEYMIETEGINDPAILSNELNNDFRIQNDTTVGAIFDMIGAEFGMLSKNLGVADEPKDDSGIWFGLFDYWHRAITDSDGTRLREMRRQWKRLLEQDNRGQQENGSGQLIDPNPPMSGIQQDKWQANGFTYDAWGKLCQDIAVNDPTALAQIRTFDPTIEEYAGPYLNNAQGIKDKWESLTPGIGTNTGGRQFGAVTVTIVNDAIAAENSRRQRYSQGQVATVELEGIIKSMQDAANAAYTAGADDNGETIRAAYEQAYTDALLARPALPYTES